MSAARGVFHKKTTDILRFSHRYNSQCGSAQRRCLVWNMLQIPVQHAAPTSFNLTHLSCPSVLLLLLLLLRLGTPPASGREACQHWQGNGFQGADCCDCVQWDIHAHQHSCTAGPRSHCNTTTVHKTLLQEMGATTLNFVAGGKCGSNGGSKMRFKLYHSCIHMCIKFPSTESVSILW